MSTKPGVAVALGAALLCGVLTAPSIASAQVSVERLQRKALEPGLGGTIEATLSLTAGNAELFDVGSTGSIVYQTLQDEHGEQSSGDFDDASTPLPFLRERVLAIGNLRYAEASGDRSVWNGFGHLRAVSMWHPRIGSETYAQLQFNEFQRLQTRLLIGLGARFELVHLREALVWAGSGLMWEYERLDVIDPEVERPFRDDLRWSSYAAARFQLGDSRFLLQPIVYVQPRLDHFGDLRLLFELAGDARVLGDLSAGLRLGVLHDTMPPEGVLGTDLRLVHTLRLEL